MDITALLGTTPQLTSPAASTTDSIDTSAFARNLDAASERQAAVDSPAPTLASQAGKAVSSPPASQQQATQPAPVPTGDTAPSQATPQETLPSSEVALTDEPATDSALPIDAQTLTTELPESLPTEAAAPQPIVVQSAPQSKPASKPAAQADTEEEAADIEPVDVPASAPALDDELDAQSDSDTRLQQIRDRMHLIDNAGNLDTSSATPSYVPITPAVPVNVDATAPASEPQSPPIATAISPSISALIKDTSGTDAQASVDTDVTPVQTPTPQADQIIASDDDGSAVTTKADTPDLTSTSGNATWNPASFTFADAAASSTTNSPVLTAAVGSAQWQTGLSQQVLGLHQRGKQQVDLQLHPADLGPLSISLKIDDNGTQAQFISAHPAVRSAVEQAIPHLREALASQGISLGQTSVSDQSSRQARDDQAAGQFSSSGQTPDQSQDSLDHEPDHEPGLSPLSGRVDVYT